MVLLSELCLRKAEMHLLKIFAVILLQNMHLHDETEAQVHLKDIY